MPPAGMSTVTEAVSPGWAVTLSPVANVMSWTVAPVLTNFTPYLPGAGTSSVAGVNPRSNAVISRVFAAAGADAAGADAWLVGGFVAPGAAADGAAQAPTTSAAPIRIDVGRSMLHLGRNDYRFGQCFFEGQREIGPFGPARRAFRTFGCATG